MSIPAGLQELFHRINAEIASQEAIRKATATVEAERDPRMPGRTAYRITGASRAVVTAAIEARINEAHDRGGFANFIGPHWSSYRRCFVALGESILSAPQPLARQ